MTTKKTTAGKTAKTLGMFVLACGLLFTNSAKDGARGPAGPVGTNGTNGIDGNANVIGTNAVTISSWTANGNSWIGSISAPGITQSIVDKGIVSVFIKYGAEWWGLPDINGINSTQYGFSVGLVSLFNSNSDGSAAPNPGAQTFRVVIISASNRLANPNVNWKNYDEVKKVLNLQD